MAHSGRFTAPPVDAAEGLCRVIWVNAWQDGELSPAEDAELDACENVVLLCSVADATEELRNAMSQRNGFEGPHFERRLREVRGRIQQFRQRMAPTEPTPAGPAAAQTTKRAA